MPPGQRTQGWAQQWCVAGQCMLYLAPLGVHGPCPGGEPGSWCGSGLLPSLPHLPPPPHATSRWPLRGPTPLPPPPPPLTPPHAACCAYPSTDGEVPFGGSLDGGAHPWPPIFRCTHWPGVLHASRWWRGRPPSHVPLCRRVRRGCLVLCNSNEELGCAGATKHTPHIGPSSGTWMGSCDAPCGLWDVCPVPSCPAP